MKITQLFLDDKFTDSGIASFENDANFSFKNIVISDQKKLNYVKSKEIEIFSHQEFENLFNTIDSHSDYIFFHCLTPYFRKLINNIKDKKSIYCWFLWGYEYYNFWPIEYKYMYLKDQNISLLEKTKKKIIFNNITFKIFESVSFFKKYYEKYYHSELLDAVKKIDYLAPVLPLEYNRIKVLNKNLKFLPYTYGNLEQYIGNNMDIDLSEKKDILLGNSADPANNHIDIINKLSTLNLEDIKVIVPLSYSGNQKYKELVLKVGREKLGDNFVPLTDFISLEKYNNIVFNCGTVIFNHIRQQAMGNIIVMGYLGAKLFLNKNSLVYKYLSTSEVTFFSTQDLSIEKIKTKLSQEKLFKNKMFFEANYSRKAVNNKIEQMLDILKEN